MDGSRLVKDFGGDLDHHDDSPNGESDQHWGNKLPWPRRSAPSDCSYLVCILLIANIGSTMHVLKWSR